MSNPSFRLRPMTPGDFLPVAQQRSRAFGRHPAFVDCMWPQHWTAAGEAAHAARIERTWRSNPAARFIIAEDPSVLDPSTGKPTLVGCSEWKVYEGNGKDPGELWSLGYLDEGGLLDKDELDWEGKYESEEKAKEERREYARFVIERFFARRKEAIMSSKGKVWVLDVLATEPSYHRKGAGTLLVQWGLDQMDAEGAEAWVEGSAAGAPLYAKLGFISVGRYMVELPKESWGESPKLGPLMMRRPAKRVT